MIDLVPVEVWRAIQTGGAASAAVLLFLYLKQLHTIERISEARIVDLKEQTGSRISEAASYMSRLEGNLARIERVIGSFHQLSMTASRLADRLDEEAGRLKLANAKGEQDAQRSPEAQAVRSEPPVGPQK